MTTKLLHISKDIALPLDAVTQSVAILAKRRVGKTYTASVLAEEMVKADLPFVALDPTGAWWGLRASADGKSEGLPVTIIGGSHGDIPLEPAAGKVIAELVVDNPGYYVIDLSGTSSNSEQDRFATDFAERLYRYKEQHKDPLHLFVDEADSFAPQRPMDGQQRMLGAFEALIRRGGIRGIGMTMITQRPAVLNKNVLTQAEMLVVLQMTAPQDQDAIDDWVKRNGTKQERDTLMSSLASLQRGQAWIWSPAWLDIFKLVQIRERTTFNSSATPRAGEKVITPRKLALVDIEALKGRVAATIEQAKSNDPRELKNRVAELERQLKAAQAPKPAPVEKKAVKEKRVEVPMLKPGELTKLESILGKASKLGEQLWKLGETFSNGSQDLKTSLATATKQLPPQPVQRPTLPARPAASAPQPVRPRADQPVAAVVPASDIVLPVGEKAILTVLIQYPDGVRREQLTVMTGYKRSSRDAYIARLKEKGLAFLKGDLVAATVGGALALPDVERLPTGAALREYWLRKLPEGERKILKELIDKYPESEDREVLSEKTGYARSSRDAYISRLSARQLIAIPAAGQVQASSILFEE